MTWAERPPERSQPDWDFFRHQAPIVLKAPKYPSSSIRGICRVCNRRETDEMGPAMSATGGKGHGHKSAERCGGRRASDGDGGGRAGARPKAGRYSPTVAFRQPGEHVDPRGGDGRGAAAGNGRVQ